MKNVRLGIVVFFFIALGPINFQNIASGAEYEGVKVTQIKKATTASNGQTLQYLKTDKPEITVLMVEIPAGSETGWHLHPVPVYAYMLSGAITVEMEGMEKYDFKEGDAILEVINTLHNGKNSGTVPAKLLVFYTGEQGSPTTVKK